MSDREALTAAFEQFAQGDFRSVTRLYDPASSGSSIAVFRAVASSADSTR